MRNITDFVHLRWTSLLS